MKVRFERMWWALQEKETLREDARLLGLSALHRVRRLDVLLDLYNHPTNEFLQLLGGRSPLLESLHIRSENNNSRFRSAISRMLSTCTLRSLSTDLCCLDWTNAPIHGLTCLYVCKRTGCLSSDGSALKSFLTALAHMPCLEELRTERISDFVIQPLPFPITFTRLRCLRIHHEDAFFAAELLNRLRTPYLRQLEVFVADSGPLAAMSQKATTLGPFLTLSYESHGGQFSAYRDEFARTPELEHDSTLEWSEQHAAALEVRVDLGTNITALPPRGDTTTLILQSGFPASGQEEWLSLTQGMESVTELRVNGGEYNEDNGPDAQYETPRSRRRARTICAPQTRCRHIGQSCFPSRTASVGGCAGGLLCSACSRSGRDQDPPHSARAELLRDGLREATSDCALCRDRWLSRRRQRQRQRGGGGGGGGGGGIYIFPHLANLIFPPSYDVPL
ncbi:hypothetical protein C8Q72DRAFT_153716 [Fomitopsis betulina]|nr:hypothetical protein C8Q72DRAFT_153716 [Fomitopsis betulina]